MYPRSIRSPLLQKWKDVIFNRVYGPVVSVGRLEGILFWILVHHLCDLCFGGSFKVSQRPTVEMGRLPGIEPHVG
jgi:hypothetical protein